MILKPLFYIIVFAVPCILAAALYIKKTKPQNRSIYVLLFWTLFFPSMVTWGCDLMSKTIVVITDSETDNTQHSIYHAYGHPKISLGDGQEVDTKNLEIGIFSKILINASSKNLLLYPVSYRNASLPSAFDKIHNKDMPEIIYIPAACYDKIEKVPDFWFQKPPSAIVENEPFFLEIFKFDSIKWCIIEYNLELEEN